MKNIHDPDEYDKYKSTNGGFNNGGSGGRGFFGWIIAGVVGLFLISFISDGAGFEAIESLLAFGFTAYLLAK